MKPIPYFAIAGGKATRFGDISKLLPKCMLPVNEKPILLHTIDKIKEHDYDARIFIMGGYLGNYLSEVMTTQAAYVFVEQEPLGTAGCLKGFGHPYIAFNADSLYNINYENFTKSCIEHGEGIYIAAKEMDDATGYGLLSLGSINKNQNIRIRIIDGFEEKPKEKKSGFVSTGMYFINMDIGSYVGDGFQMLETDVFPKLAKEGKLFVYTDADFAPVDDLVKLKAAEGWLKEESLQHAVEKI